MLISHPRVCSRINLLVLTSTNPNQQKTSKRAGEKGRKWTSAKVLGKFSPSSRF